MRLQQTMRRGACFPAVTLLYVILAGCAGFGAGLAASTRPGVAGMVAGELSTAPAAEAVPSDDSHAAGGAIQAAPAPAPKVTPALEQVAVAGAVHRVRRGDTLWALARAYNTTPVELARLNGLNDADFLMPGIELKIPGPGGLRPDTRLDLAVPVMGPVSSGFGYRWGRLHEGIDIASAYGHPVRAAADGRVVFAGSKGTYGRLVVLEHANYTQTWYGHLSRISVKNGQNVTKGTTIGLVGSTGHSTGPHLHFEVRVRGRPIDPSFVLGVNLSGAQPAGTSPGGLRT
ncbi:MAG: peptidoglycan DD-metalloendopeptidase family protein [Ignavibacteriales bacterium]